MQVEQKNLEHKCEKLHQQNIEKDRSKKGVADLYQKLKQQQMAAGIEIAADHDAENVLEAAHYNTTNHRNVQQRTGRAGSNGSHGSGARAQATNYDWQNRVEGSRTGLQSARKSCSAPAR